MSTHECPQASDEAKKLYRALNDRFHEASSDESDDQIRATLEWWDEHKHVDMCIKEAKLYIEVDGPRHKFSRKQIKTDHNRDRYSSEEGYKTLRFTNKKINENLEEVLNEIITETHNRLKS
ncbi:endonuclease domain-containing protein [bacterium]|nr:endonuclease domain-containing protein [bacterium]